MENEPSKLLVFMLIGLVCVYFLFDLAIYLLRKYVPLNPEEPAVTPDEIDYNDESSERPGGPVKIWPKQHDGAPGTGGRHNNETFTRPD